MTLSSCPLSIFCSPPRVYHHFTHTTLEAIQGQIAGFFGQVPYKCHQNRVASVGDGLKICSWVTSRVV